MNDDLMFQDEPEPSSKRRKPEPETALTIPPWTLLVVDDEEAVHQVTHLALRGMQFDGRSLTILSARSAAEARSILEDTPGIAVILLDVVMETDHAGLELVHYIREDLGNRDTRIVLRTGQPGQAPEMDVISGYDINDYKDKTELTAQKLYTLMLACLRSYRDIEVLHQSRAGLQNVIRAARALFCHRRFCRFLRDSLEHLGSLLNLDDKVVYLFEVGAFRRRGEQFEDLTADISPDLSGCKLLGGLPESLKVLLERSYQNRENCFSDEYGVIYCRGHQSQVLFAIRSPRPVSELDHRLLDLLADNMNIALENIDLNEKLRDSQQDIICRMTELVETHSKESGHHVLRVSLYAELLAQLVGLPEEEVEMIRHSAPLHDLGKIGIPDRVLKKPGPLEAEEWEIMKTHAQLGYMMLAGSGLPLLDQGALISLSHHEHWDGSGYPRGLKGEDIPMIGRIMALADVFDALGSDRCYKKGWEIGAVLAYIEAHSGRFFDPRLVQLFRDNLDQFLEIRDRYHEQRAGDHPVAV